MAPTPPPGRQCQQINSIFWVFLDEQDRWAAWDCGGDAEPVRPSYEAAVTQANDLFRALAHDRATSATQAPLRVIRQRPAHESHDQSVVESDFDG